MHIILFIFLVISVLFIIVLLIKCCCCLVKRRRKQGAGGEELSVVYTQPSANQQPLLPSRPSAPSLASLTQSSYDLRRNPQSSHDLRRNHSTQSFEDLQVRTEHMRSTQIQLLKNEVRANNDDTPNCPLIIGVFAAPSCFGGYCVNQRDNVVKFYSIQAEDIPLHLSIHADPTELEMKNFLFALMLWSRQITDVKKLLMYTASPGIDTSGNRYGRRANKLLEHFESCEGVAVENSCSHSVNWKRDPKTYAVHILPAEDLSSDNLDDFYGFVSKYYGIHADKFIGTHTIPQQVRFRKFSKQQNIR